MIASQAYLHTRGITACRRLGSTMAGTHLKFPFARSHGAEPSPEYGKLRSSNPVSRVELWDGHYPWLIVKHADACSILTDPRLSKERLCSNFPETAAGRLVAAKHHPTFADIKPPNQPTSGVWKRCVRHNDSIPVDVYYRRLIAPFFTREKIDAMRHKIRFTVDSVIEQMINGGCEKPVDLADKFSAVVPSLIMHDMLGIPSEHSQHLIGMNAIRTSEGSTAAAAAKAYEELFDFIDKLVQRRITEPGHGIINILVNEQVKSGQAEKSDIVQIVFLLLITGHATIANMINLGVVTLLEHPAQLADLKKDSTLATQCVEELCRFHTVAAFTNYRCAKEDIRFRNQMIKSGDGIIVSNQSANRDEEVFQDANSFNIHRERGQEESLGFGYGDHRCAAEWLARAELEIALSTLFLRLPNIRLGIPYSEIKYTAPTNDVGINELPVIW